MREPRIAVPEPSRVDRNVIRLDGCRPTPLGSYLKALGVLRLVCEQADREARGWWAEEAFMLETVLSSDGLEEFFLERYAPSPILAPWNGGSGFYPTDNTEALEAIVAGRAERFEGLRAAIEQVRDLLTDEGLEERPDGVRKDLLLLRLRAEADESLLPWIDAAVMLCGEGPRYPPLLGTGGNDGRLDFTNNFMGRLVEIIDVNSGSSRETAAGLLRESLFASPVASLGKAAIGQFAPGAAGGPNASTGYSGAPLVNAWDFVLMLEGATLFASSAARRLETIGEGQLAYPFTVRTTGSGSGAASHADEGSARAETWMPLWARPTTLREIQATLGEGRVVVGRRRARDGLDFARAVSKLGVERGITSFQRYAYLMRAGRAYLATPISRVSVSRNPAADLIDELDQGAWLNRFRRFGRGKGQPARLTSLLRRLEDALFGLTSGAGRTAASVQEVLVVLGQVQRYLATSPKAMDVCRPVPLLGWEWAKAANDGSAEFRVAAALAGLHATLAATRRAVLPMGAHMAPLAPDSGRIREWDPGAQNRVVWGARGLEDNLGRVMLRRTLEADHLNLDDVPLSGYAAAPLSATSAWLVGKLSEHRIAELLLGLSLAHIPRGFEGWIEEAEPPPAAYALLKPLFTTRAQLRRTGWLADDVALPLSKDLVRLLVTHRTNDAIASGCRLLRSRRLVAGGGSVGAPGITGPRLLSVLMAPLSDSELNRLLRRSYVRSEHDESDSPRPSEED